jgi:ABC-2 type transport system ATP-binding protein
MSTAIVVEDLRKSYGATDAVAGVSFEVREGEVFALLGPNGAGKTTTVEILEGYRARSSGRVEVLGADPMHGGKPWRERIGIVLQSCGLDPYLTVAEYVLHTGRAYPHARPVDELLALVGLSEKAGARVKTLSGGQQRRLDLALALVGDPDLIFLDEPTTGFDPSARRGAWDLVEGLCDLGKTVMLTTHFMDEAQHLADRVAVIVGGRIVAEGTPETIGGRDLAAVRIRFALPEGIAAADLPVPALAADQEEPGYVELTTDDATHVLHRLTGWALDREVPLRGLTVTRPTLEDVYLELTDPSDGTDGSPPTPDRS